MPWDYQWLWWIPSSPAAHLHLRSRPACFTPIPRTLSAQTPVIIWSQVRPWKRPILKSARQEKECASNFYEENDVQEGARGENKWMWREAEEEVFKSDLHELQRWWVKNLQYSGRKASLPALSTPFHSAHVIMFLFAISIKTQAFFMIPAGLLHHIGIFMSVCPHSFSWGCKQADWAWPCQPSAAWFFNTYAVFWRWPVRILLHMYAIICLI